MACFIVPLTGAAVTHLCTRFAAKKNAKLSTRLGWLTRLLGGGAFLLAFEHVWHGEVVPWFPFLTATSDPEDTAEMLHEMATSGTAMLLLCIVMWGIMCAVVHHLETKALVAKEEV